MDAVNMRRMLTAEGKMKGGEWMAEADSRDMFIVLIFHLFQGLSYIFLIVIL